jgi:putative membrane protein
MKPIQNIKWTAGLVGAALALALSVQPALAQQGGARPSTQPSTLAQTGQLNRQDENFLAKAARIDMEEVQGGQLALQRATSPAVRTFAQHMINDHSKAQTGLKEVASQKGAAVPTQLSQKQSSALQHLEGLSGAKFDRAYAQAMVKGHTQAVKAFQAAAKTLNDPDLRAWAQTTLPLLQEHLRMAKSMEAAVQARK